MKETLQFRLLLFISCVIISTSYHSCKEEEDPIKFAYGTFPDSVKNLIDLNSQFDDYNTDIYQITGGFQLIFSSNRKSSGGQFDIEQGFITYVFDQTTGDIELTSAISNDSFTNKLIAQAVTTKDDFGPYRFFSTADGYEYLILSSVNENGNLDLYYLKNLPAYGSNMPAITGPNPVNIFNSGSDDVYICFDSNLDTAYFSSNRGGNFDIYRDSIPNDSPLSNWFDRNVRIPFKPDSINSTSDEKCPYVHKNVMVFASNRLGGLGGYDLYYSVFKNRKWNSPVNFGPTINTSYDEYRPVLGSVQDFTNSYMIFSSNRTGGKGGYDLYFTGLELPE
jgi:hypothetical protein